MGLTKHVRALKSGVCTPKLARNIEGYVREVNAHHALIHAIPTVVTAAG